MCALVSNGSLWKTLDASSFYSKIPAAQLVRLIQQAAPFVQDLNLRGCSQIKSDINLPLNNLVRASFEGCRFFSRQTLEVLLVRNGKLRQLDISGLAAVNDQVMLIVATHCPLLESLDISYCKHVTEKGVNYVLTQLPRLQDVRLGECRISERTILALNKLPHLKRLSLTGCISLSDSWIKGLIYGDVDYGVMAPETRVRSSLIHLNLSRCTALTAEALKYMRWVMPELQKLELAGLLELTDSAFSDLLPTLPSLTHIDLEDCAISDITLIALTSCESLRHIQLSHCARITDDGVLTIIEQLPLNHLDLDNTRVSDRVLSAIAAKSQPMRLSIYDCPSLSWTGVLSILTANSSRPQSLKRLKTFYGWQRPVDGHTKRCRRGDLAGAKEVEKEWATYMIGSSEELLKTGEGRTRFLDFDEEGVRIVGRTRRRSRACVVM